MNMSTDDFYEEFLRLQTAGFKVALLWNGKTIRREDGVERMALRNTVHQDRTLKGIYPKANGLGLLGPFTSVVTTLAELWSTPCYRLPDDRIGYIFKSNPDWHEIVGERTVRDDFRETTYTIRAVRDIGLDLPANSEAVTPVPPTSGSVWVKDILEPYVAEPTPIHRAKIPHPAFTKRPIMQLPDDLRLAFRAARPFDTLKVSFS